MLLDHLRAIGYTQMDLVEMPGQFTRRGGILDVYSPEIDRPVRIEFFGDEIESIRKFEPETQRSSTPLDEAQLLPLTETPVTEHLLAAVHARLSRSRMRSLQGDDDATRPGHARRRRRRCQRLPRLGVLLRRGRCRPHTLRSLPQPAGLRRRAGHGAQPDRALVEQGRTAPRALRHRLAHPAADIYLRPWELQAKVAALPGLDLDQLGAVDVLDEDINARRRSPSTRAPRCASTAPFPPSSSSSKSLSAQEHRIIIAAPNQGDVERLATLLREYGLAYRLGSRIQHTGSETIYEEASYLAGDMRVPVIVRTAIANGVSFPDANLVVFGANDLSDDADIAARPVPTRSKSKTAAFVSDFRDLTVGDYVVHVEHGIAATRA